MTSELQLPSINDLETSPKIIVCRGRSCRKYNAEKIFDNFQQNLPTDTKLISVPCLGQCGNGPMVLVESDRTWYWQVHPDEVKKVIEQHIIKKHPVKAMLYPKFHSQK